MCVVGMQNPHSIILHPSFIFPAAHVCVFSYSSLCNWNIQNAVNQFRLQLTGGGGDVEQCTRYSQHRSEVLFHSLFSVGLLCLCYTSSSQRHNEGSKSYRIDGSRGVNALLVVHVKMSHLFFTYRASFVLWNASLLNLKSHSGQSYNAVILFHLNKQRHLGEGYIYIYIYI